MPVITVDKHPCYTQVPNKPLSLELRQHGTASLHARYEQGNDYVKPRVKVYQSSLDYSLNWMAAIRVTMPVKMMSSNSIDAIFCCKRTSTHTVQRGLVVCVSLRRAAETGCAPRQLTFSLSVSGSLHDLWLMTYMHITPWLGLCWSQLGHMYSFSPPPP